MQETSRAVTTKLLSLGLAKRLQLLSPKDSYQIIELDAKENFKLLGFSQPLIFPLKLY